MGARKAFLIAGEPSGDRLGGALMAGLTELAPGIKFEGVGGPQMANAGLKSLFPMEELSVMGIAEVLPKYRMLKRRIRQTAEAAIASGADVLIGIDSPDFCLRVDRIVRAARPDLRIVHYVAPSVWAWRPGRAAKMARHVDHVLALLPFEPPYMEAAGMRCDFVGHPVVAEPVASGAEIAAFRAKYNLGEAKLILALPGSRRSEVGRLAPIFGEALGAVYAQHKEARIVIPTLPHLRETLEQETKGWNGPRPLILAQGMENLTNFQATKRAAFGAADLALAASGTVSLELAAAKTPMVIAYDMSWLSWQIMSRMARIDTVTLVNLIVGNHAIPEFLGPACKPTPIAKALGALIDDKAAIAAQRAAMAQTMEALGQGAEAPGLRAARAVLDGLA
ncbi:MAG: lipid-A-disaccharide synthase [Halocynthiibacter sp.]|jgi:lipid-A-disaccharide synthase